MTEQESKIEGKFNVIAILVHQQIALIQKLQAANEALEARMTAIERRMSPGGRPKAPKKPTKG